MTGTHAAAPNGTDHSAPTTSSATNGELHLPGNTDAQGHRARRSEDACKDGRLTTGPRRVPSLNVSLTPAIAARRRPRSAPLTTVSKKVDVSHFPHYGLKRGMYVARRREMTHD
jgi:hypothetical protein